MKRLALITVPIIVITAYALRIAANPAVGPVRTYTDDKGGFVQIGYSDNRVGYVVISEQAEANTKISRSLSSGWGIVGSELAIDAGSEPVLLRLSRMPTIIRIAADGAVESDSNLVSMVSVQQLMDQLDQVRGVRAVEIATAWLGQHGAMNESQPFSP